MNYYVAMLSETRTIFDKIENNDLLNISHQTSVKIYMQN